MGVEAAVDVGVMVGVRAVEVVGDGVGVIPVIW